MTINDYPIEIESYNSAGIRSEARVLGITHMREVERHGEGDQRIMVFALLRSDGCEIRVVDTNGDPVWEENDPTGFAELTEEATS